MEYVLIGIDLLLFLVYNVGSSFSSAFGYSMKTRNNDIYIKGKILSLELNNKLIHGDKELKPTGTNTISQNSNNLFIELKGGHCKVNGNPNNIYLNNKKINYTL